MKNIKQELRNALAESGQVDAQIAERYNFLRWITKTAPGNYRHLHETPECISAIRGYTPVSNGMTTYYLAVEKVKSHATGLGTAFGDPCYRCLRVLSAMGSFIADYKKDSFNPEVQVLADLEYMQRISEGKFLFGGSPCKGDGLYLIGARTSKGISGNTNHLTFFDDWSLSAGKDALEKRIAQSGFSSLEGFNLFDNPEIKEMNGVNHYTMKSVIVQGNTKSILEIISRS